jgi:hypothetical protein
MAVDLPAPFSPTMAWMVPGATARLTRSLASTSPKRLVISRSSIIGFLWLYWAIASVTLISPRMIRALAASTS